METTDVLQKAIIFILFQATFFTVCVLLGLGLPESRLHLTPQQNLRDVSVDSNQGYSAPDSVKNPDLFWQHLYAEEYEIGGDGHALSSSGNNTESKLALGDADSRQADLRNSGENEHLNAWKGSYGVGPGRDVAVQYPEQFPFSSQGVQSLLTDGQNVPNTMSKHAGQQLIPQGVQRPVASLSQNAVHQENAAKAMAKLHVRSHHFQTLTVNNMNAANAFAAGSPDRHGGYASAAPSYGRAVAAAAAALAAASSEHVLPNKYRHNVRAILRPGEGISMMEQDKADEDYTLDDIGANNSKLHRFSVDVDTNAINTGNVVSMKNIRYN